MRKRGKKWMYGIDLGDQAAQICRSCLVKRGRAGKQHPALWWVENGKRLRGCPRCKGPLLDVQRRRQQWVGGFEREREAHKAMTEALGKLDKDIYVGPTKETVAEFMIRWIEGRQDALRESTYRSYRWIIQAYIVPRLGTIRMQKLRPEHLTAFYKALRENGRVREGDKRGPGLSKRTVRYVHIVLSRALRDAERWGAVARNVARLIDAPGTSTSERPCWTVEEARRFMSHVKEHRLATLWRHAMESGERRGELLGAEWEDLADGGIWVQRALVMAGGQCSVSQPKTERGRRFVPLDDGTLAQLRRHRLQQNKERLAAGEAWVEKPFGLNLIYRTAVGTAIDPNNLTTSFQAAARRAGVTVVPFHSLRHFAAVMHARRGTPPTVAADILGIDVAILQGVYQKHAQPDLARDAVRSVASILWERG